MTLSNDLKTLRPGDVLVLRSGIRRIVEKVSPAFIDSVENESPHSWHTSDGARFGAQLNPKPHPDDIVRVIRKAKPEKRRKGAAVAACLKIVEQAKQTHLWDDGTYDHLGGHSYVITEYDRDSLIRRLRKIARRLERGA